MYEKLLTVTCRYSDLEKVFNVPRILHSHQIKFGSKVRRNNETGSSLDEILRNNILLASND